MNNIFIPLPKSSKAVRCEDHITISLISHTAKIVLNIIKNRIAPIIEQQLSDSQYGFRTGRGTRDAICQLRIMMERCLEIQKTLYIRFIDYTKAFDRVKGTLYRIKILCRRYTFWSYPAGLTIADPSDNKR